MILGQGNGINLLNVSFSEFRMKKTNAKIILLTPFTSTIDDTNADAVISGLNAEYIELIVV